LAGFFRWPGFADHQRQIEAYGVAVRLIAREEDLGAALERQALPSWQELLEVDRGARGERAILHFDDDERPAFPRDQIELGADGAEDARQDRPALGLKLAADQSLGGAVP
jgi:hypothetical protein